MTREEKNERARLALRAMNTADDLNGRGQWSDEADAREVEADAWEEAGAPAQAKQARDDAALARMRQSNAERLERVIQIVRGTPQATPEETKR